MVKPKGAWPAVNLNCSNI